jgi:quercetin dioxygenase-like cupin family protein
MTRILLAIMAGAVLALLCGGTEKHNHGKGSVAKILSAVDIAEKVDGKEARATTLEVTFEPGAASKPHRHPGPVFGYVLEGELEFQAGDSKPQRLKTGDTFYEQTAILHTVSRNPSDKNKTRVLVVLLHPRDAIELVIPVPTHEKR